ncbi:diguanylate cyclase [Psychrobacillus sp. OK028]|uniref:diguanylate cyclase n=1 Tax=Psychrobacillus sp. OK028 TaxID=1884359 RepID=UPI00088B18EE|nr:diguanylate cyclase [Psychrobacillus sp. OK028]SDN25684.1 diguanylate cyclase [Psychrobacillus sp. OK028]
MLIDFIINFCILFTFAILTYIPFQNRLKVYIPSSKYTPYILGILSGFTGCLLMLTAVSISDFVIMDGRMAVIALSGVLGGPVATIISGTIIGVFRLFMYGYSTTSLIAGSSTIIVGVVIGFWSWKKTMTFRNVHYFFGYSIVQTSIVLGFLGNWKFETWLAIISFILYSILSFFIIFVILKQLSSLFEKIKHIEEMSITDYLTGLNNNRKFQEYTYNLLSKGEIFSLLLLDIDYFKKVNDTYGHPVGDEVLKELALRIKEASNSFGGIVSRNGGEEFSVLLPNTSENKSLEIAELIRQAIEKNAFPISTGEKLAITISGGISTFPQDAATTHELYKLADEALYLAKASGRNKVVHTNQNKLV